MKMNCIRLAMLACSVVGLILATGSNVTAAEKHNILLVAGKPSHGYGSHEHYAGLKVLEESLQASDASVNVTVVRGWPEDKSLVEAADSIVIYCDGGERHLAIPHLQELRGQLLLGTRQGESLVLLSPISL